MKAITLYQPWATLWVLREKKIETRSWHRKFRGNIAIHSSINFPKWAKELCHEEPFKSVLQKHGISIKDLPLGAILGFTEIVDIVKMDNQNTRLLSPQELAFGDYRPGRFMWISKDGKVFDKPIAAKGKQGIWNWEVPEGYKVN
ncbi:MAG: 2-oxoglutarate dehydrogenase E1 [Clostridiaceae bacterium]|nr:2-oxoglutarate dehydrogenase E1 [Clostridiaceae bacterium]